MAHLMLGVLGSLQVTLADGETAEFRSDQTRALLAYLAVEADRPHRREALIGLLWPDQPEVTARHNLRQALVNLRKAIGDHAADPPYLLITHDEIRFNAQCPTSNSLNPFLGRECELADLGRLIADPNCRCITLVAPGGMGKTRLAIQAAANHRNEFAQGVAFVQRPRLVQANR